MGRRKITANKPPGDAWLETGPGSGVERERQIEPSGRPRATGTRRLDREQIWYVHGQTEWRRKARRVHQRTDRVMKRLVILDPGLITVLSHNYSEANALVREARDLRLAATVFCHREAHVAVRQIPATPFFRQHSYGYTADARPAADFMSIDFCNRSTLKDLEALPVTLTCDDFVLFPTVTCNIVLAICQWLGNFEPARAPRFGLCLMFAPDANAAGRSSAVALDTYRRAFAQVPAGLAGRLVHTCEIDAISRMYEPIVGVRPVTLAIPTWAAMPDEPAMTDGMRISFLGGARAEKGFQLLPEVIAAVRERHARARFTVQAVGHEADLVRSVTGRLAVHRDVVTLIHSPLSDGAFRAAMRRSSLLLLPYDSDRYGRRGASLFTEAKLMGIPMVLPDGTAIGKDGRRKGIATTFEAFTARSVADATMRAIDRISELSRRARQVALSERAGASGYLRALLSGPGCPS
jgi:glycosyltransferase involved in cell wall biosynthesis